ncbi:hypothetical protein P692DRAFT_201898638, partial [Suillus brevipes Sb2]
SVLFLRVITRRSLRSILLLCTLRSTPRLTLIDGWKSVELCQAYILMSIYAVPVCRWEEERSWLYTALAARTYRYRLEFASGVYDTAPDGAPGAGDVDSYSRVYDMF